MAGGLLQIQINNERNYALVAQAPNDDYNEQTLLASVLANMFYYERDSLPIFEGGYVAVETMSAQALIAGRIDNLGTGSEFNLGFRGFKRDEVRSFIANEFPMANYYGALSEWQSDLAQLPDNQVNSYINRCNHAQVVALDKPNDYLDIITFTRSKSGDVGDNIKQYDNTVIDMFDALLKYVPNHVNAYDTDDFYLAQVDKDTIIFRTAALIETSFAS